jgi:hypothetical protein
MGLISSVVMGVAGGIFSAGRSAYQKAAAQKSANAGAATNAVRTAQAQSAREKMRLAGLNAKHANAGKFSFAQHYQAQVAKAVDTDHNGTISHAELNRQVQASGGTSDQANAIYQAMDQNGDGKVSIDEFKNGIPVPSTAKAQQVLQMLKASQTAQAAQSGPLSGRVPAQFSAQPAHL